MRSVQSCVRSRTTLACCRRRRKSWAGVWPNHNNVLRTYCSASSFLKLHEPSVRVSDRKWPVLGLLSTICRWRMLNVEPHKQFRPSTVFSTALINCDRKTLEELARRYWCYLHSMRSRVCVTIGCPPVYPSVCLVDWQQRQRAAGLLLSIPAIDRYLVQMPMLSSRCG